MKILVLGYSGSGKSTLAKAISKKWGIPTLHLDSVHHLPGWQERTRESENEIVSAFLEENSSWVIDGNYSKVCYKQRLDEADEIILLLLGRFTCFFRAYRRFKNYRGVTRPDMADGCDEKFDREFITWLLFGGRTKERRRKLESVITDYPGKVTVVRTVRQLKKLYANLGIK